MTPGQTSDLKAVLGQRGPFPPRLAVEVVRQIAAAVDEAHSRQHGHRPISTETVLVSGLPAPQDGRSDQTGTGLTAYLADDARATPSADPTRVFVTDPEVTYRADIAALAGLLYQCLTGAAPSTPLQPPSRLRPGVPAGLDEVIARGMADDPPSGSQGHQGYRSAAEFAAAADAALVAAREPAPTDTPTNPEAPLPDPAGATQTIHLPTAAATRTLPLPPSGGAAPPPPAAPVPDRAITYPSGPIRGYPPQFAPPPKPRKRRRLAIILAAIAIVVAVDVIAAIVIPRLTRHPAPTAGTAPPTHIATRNYSTVPVALPFPGLDRLKSVGLDAAGNIYVLAALGGMTRDSAFDPMQAKVFKLAPGAASPTELQIPGVEMREANDMAVDAAGNVYLSDRQNMWELQVGTPTPIRLPFRGFVAIEAIAIDSAGNAYAAGPLTGKADPLRYGVKKLAPGDTRPTELHFTDLYQPRGIAVDKAGNVYACVGVKGSGKGKVLKLAVGANTSAVLPIEGIEPLHAAIDAAGNLFVADGFVKGLFELEPGAAAARSLPLNVRASSVAVDGNGVVYLTAIPRKDPANDTMLKPGEVLKLTPDP